MKNIITILVAMITVIAASADTFNYRFKSVPVSEALSKVAEDHPSININFIYNELENYITSSIVRTDNPMTAIRSIIGLNPVKVSSRGNTIYVEALQHGKFRYTGRALSKGEMPVAAATVYVLAPKDSTIITYGITDDAGRFSIPCDRKNVILKVTSIGYHPEFRNPGSFSVGNIIMRELPRTLRQLTVEGVTQKVVNNGVAYVPGKKIKKAAIDAGSLLFRMQIPQLNVSPDGKSVKTAAGDDVALFIDYMPASPNDTRSLQPSDVLRVEVLDFPIDSRFMSAQHVVNFIMQKYEWGGYTKLLADGSVFGNPDAEGGLYQKYVHKNWVFDASVSADGSWGSKNRYDSSESFKDFDYKGSHYDRVDRKSNTYDYKSRTNNQDIAIRASYIDKSKYLLHTLSFNRTGAPELSNKSSVDFSDGILPSTESFTVESSQSISLRLTGLYNFTLPKGNSLLVNWWFGHSGNRSSSDYRLGTLDPIINLNKEKVYNPNLSLQYSKNLGHNNTFRTFFSSYARIYDTKYGGSVNDREKLISSESMLFLEYIQNWGGKLNLYTRVGASYVLGRINGKNFLTEWNPRLGVQLNYTINRKNSASLMVFWANSSPSATTANEALVQRNELLWSRGNPYLKNIYGPITQLTYNLIPNNKFSLSAAINYTYYKNMMLYDFRPEAGIDGIVRTFTSRNNTHDFSASVNSSLRLLNNSLIFSAGIELHREVLTGNTKRGLTSWTGTRATASYYLGNTSFTLFYFAPQKSIKNSGFEDSVGCRYGLIGTYALGRFNVQLSFSNWFNRNGGERLSYSSPYYDLKEWRWNEALSRSLSLSLSYTFSYGKKVNRNDEVRSEASRQSAILQ